MKRKIRNKIADAIDGHKHFKNLTVYGDNAMHFGCTYWTKKFGYICFRLPLPCGIADKLRYGKGNRLHWRPLYFYISRNATPWAAVFMIGKKHNRTDWVLARVRKAAFGWKYNSDDEYQHERLYQINNIL
jgi:hypothetical protein